MTGLGRFEFLLCLSKNKTKQPFFALISYRRWCKQYCMADLAAVILGWFFSVVKPFPCCETDFIMSSMGDHLI